MISRRHILLAGTAVAVAGASGLAWSMRRHSHASAGEFEITLSDGDWRAKLSEEQYLVLRHEETEKSFSSPLAKEKRRGTYHCAGCDLAAYSSAAKYNSGTGWPSFYESLPDAIRTKEDDSLFAARTEIHCRRCGGHFGHLFDDGPPPTGKRHCLNGLALTFRPATT